MSPVALPAEATPWRLLPPAAVGALAHDLRGAIHVIRGHAELLGAEASGAEARASAKYILDASVRLGALCEDILDFLRLPGVAPGESVAFALDDIGRSLTVLAADRGVHLRIVEPEADFAGLLVHATVRRVVLNVLEHLARTAEDDVTITIAIDDPGDSCAITVAPMPISLVDNGDGVLAIAAELLSVLGGRLSAGSNRLDMHFPVVGARQ